MFRLTLVVLAVSVSLSYAHGHAHGSTTAKLLRSSRQVEPTNQTTTINSPPPPSPPHRGNDRSIYARKASAIEGKISDVYEAKSAIVVLNEDKNSGTKGVLFLTQEGSHAPVKINGTVTGLTPGKHGFHVHQSGNTQNGCGSTGGHFNPFMQPHGAPGDDKRHIGDLGNIVADDQGVCNVQIEDSKLSLNGISTILGRAIVVHEKEDDLGKGGDEGSMKTGNAGGRVSCGVIAVN